jgi:hypothetical protein
MARQFIPITRIKLEEYVANFPKLIESGKDLHLFKQNVQASNALTFRLTA